MRNPPKPARIRIDVQAVRIETDVSIPTVQLNSEMLDEIYQVLGVSESEQGRLRVQLQQLADGYILVLTLLSQQGKPKDGPARLKKLVEYLEGVETALFGLSLGMHSQLQQGLPRLLDGPDCSLIVLREHMKHLHQTATLIGRQYEAKEGRPSIGALDTLIASLMLLFKQHTGKLPTMSTEWAEKESTRHPPREAKAILAFLKQVDCKVPHNTIANRIAAVRKRYPGDKLRTEFGHALFIPDRITFH